MKNDYEGNYNTDLLCYAVIPENRAVYSGTVMPPVAECACRSGGICKLVERLEIHNTPKHGSWLDIAETELPALGRQCISNHRITDLPALQSLLKPWTVARNAAQKGVDWQFTTDDART